MPSFFSREIAILLSLWRFWGAFLQFPKNSVELVFLRTDF